jgi:MtrB/PioB family decaheme-associated outer membrane protein
MTTRILAVGLLSALLGASPALAQTPVGQPPASDTPVGAPLDINLRSVDFGVRLTDVSGDEAQFYRYRDYRTGPSLNGFRMTSEDANRMWRAEADNLGYRDQRFSAEYERIGRFKGWFEYNQIPYEQEYTSRTPFTVQGLTAVTVDDALQAAIGSGSTTLMNSVDAFSNFFELRTRRDITTLGGQYQVNRNLDVNLSFMSTGRKGHQPLGASFGMASTFEVPAPIDQRNNELAASVEWANRTAMFRAGYDGSFFDSRAESLTFDNPLRLTNATNASSLGRLARWPSSTMHTVSATASVALPAKSRVVAYVAQSAMASDVDLLPWTINPAIAAPALPRTSLDADADVTTALVRFTSRPARWAWLNASFRSYDFNNQTAPFKYDQKVSYDAVLVNTPGESAHPYSFNRALFEADGSFTPFRNGAFRVGYVREDVDRTNRIYRTTVEDSVRLGYDWTSNRYVTLRTNYVHSQRRGRGFDVGILEDVNEQPGMRHADISNRDRDQFQVVATVMPTTTLSLNVNGSVGKDDRPGVEFGLQSQDFSSFGVGADYAPSDAFTMGVSYLYETFASREASRTANPAPDPGFFDPRRNWYDDIDENVDTVSAYLEVPKVMGKIDFAVNYDYTRADTSWFYSLAPNTVLPQPAQLAPVFNAWSQARLVSNYWLRRNLSLGVTYLLDRFDVNDWALGPQTLDRLAHSNTFLLMNYSWANYTAHTVWLKATYLW